MGSTMWWIVSLSIKAGLLLAASWLGALVLRRATAAARHQIWALGVAGALLLPALALLLPALPLSLETPAAGGGRTIQATMVFVTGGHHAGAAPQWPLWLAGIWGTGTLLVALWFARAHLAALRLVRRAEPARAGAWIAARREAATGLGITREIAIGRSDSISSPMTVGLLRPRVLLPAGADDWSPERLRAVLLHELGHVRRRDTLVQLGAQLVCALHWWNPLAWLAAARLRVEREHACDDLVLHAGIRASSYAEDLLEVARGRVHATTAHAGAISMVDRSGTESRLRRILDSATPRRPLGAPFRLAAAGAALALAGGLACMHGELDGRDPSESSAPRAATVNAAPASGGQGPVWIAWVAVEDTAPRALLDPEKSIDKSVVEAEILRHLGQLEQCYEARRQERPGLVGKVIMHWSIQDGRATEHRVQQNTLEDDEVISCLETIIEQAKFPVVPGDPVEVAFPFFFGAPPGPEDDGC
jgi:beta-lactamase regulating signal transducer with metallopeptidase domain